MSPEDVQQSWELAIFGLGGVAAIAVTMMVLRSMLVAVGKEVADHLVKRLEESARHD